MNKRQELVEKMCKAFCDKQNESNNRRLLNCWDDTPDDIKQEIRNAMEEVLNEVTVQGGKWLAFKFDKPVNGSWYLTRGGKVVLFTQSQAAKMKLVNGKLLSNGKFREYDDTLLTVIFDDFD